MVKESIEVAGVLRHPGSSSGLQQPLEPLQKGIKNAEAMAKDVQGIATEVKVEAQREKPAWNKVFIGAGLTVIECLLFGHAMEQMKILRQATGQSYANTLRNAYNDLGVYGVMYRGLFPWGIVQAVSKGLPILFVPGEIKRATKGLMSENKRNLFSGVIGGMAQGVCVAPTQRLKTIAMTKKQGESPMGVVRELIRKEGILTLTRGTMLMSIRRGTDWGIRFFGLFRVKKMLEERSGGKKNWHNFVAGFAGGAMSVSTMPIDTMIARSQKVGGEQTVRGAFKEVMSQHGVRGFFNGTLGRIGHSGWHTAIVAGGGLLMHEKYEQYKKDRASAQ